MKTDAAGLYSCRIVRPAAGLQNMNVTNASAPP